MPDSPTLDPAATILLLMDFQAGIVDRFPIGAETMAAAQRALTTARQHGAHVGYVRVGLTPEEIAAMPDGAPMKAMVANRGAGLHPDASETQVHDQIARAGG